MTVDVFRFEFDRSVDLAEAEMTLQLAMIALEGLIGVSRVLLETSYHVDAPRRAVIVDGSTHVGGALIRIFTSFLIHEFSNGAFQVGRVTPAEANYVTPAEAN